MKNVEAQMQALELLNEREQELRWVEENIEDLKKSYDEKFVAIKNKRVIAYGSRMEEVIKNLKTQGVDPTETLVYFVSKIAVIL